MMFLNIRCCLGWIENIHLHITEIMAYSVCTGMMLTQEMSYISLILMNGRRGCFRRDILTRMIRKSLLILYQKYALIRRHFL